MFQVARNVWARVVLSRGHKQGGPPPKQSEHPALRRWMYEGSQKPGSAFTCSISDGESFMCIAVLLDRSLACRTTITWTLDHLYVYRIMRGGLSLHLFFL